MTGGGGVDHHCVQIMLLDAPGDEVHRHQLWNAWHRFLEDPVQAVVEQLGQRLGAVLEQIVDEPTHGSLRLWHEGEQLTVEPIDVHRLGLAADGHPQGVGQALMEHTVYDDDSGQLLSSSFMDYTMPRADDLPSMNIDTNEVPCLTNPLGVKGAGEAGALVAPPVVIAAIANALRDYGVSHIDMPATPERIWELMQNREAAE